MNKITAYIVLVLHIVVFHFGQNAYSASSALTESPADMSFKESLAFFIVLESFSFS